MNPAPAKKSRPLLRVLLRLLVICFGCHLAVVVAVTIFQRRLIYFPPVYSAATLEEWGRNEQLERWRNAAGENLGWQRKCPVQPARGQVLITHGNGGAAIHCGHYADVLQQAADVDVFIVEYPGYADRAGSPSEQSLYQAGDEAFAVLATNRPVYLLGESLGTGVAAYLAGHHPDRVAGMVLLAPFNRLAAVGQLQMPIVPVSLLLRDRFPSEDHLRDYHGPVAMFIVSDDQVVPPQFGRLLYAAYSGPKKLWEIPTGNHGAVMEQPAEKWGEVFEFWREHGAGGAEISARPSHQ